MASSFSSWRVIVSVHSPFLRVFENNGFPHWLRVYNLLITFKNKRGEFYLHNLKVTWKKTSWVWHRKGGGSGGSVKLLVHASFSYRYKYFFSRKIRDKQDTFVEMQIMYCREKTTWSNRKSVYILPLQIVWLTTWC
jgi:hypothetical protein